mmetsp:Transcript_14386/g.39301  ORF Transcript_14386/g.39301 Transcript_14386/m.39301 type:complete len:172 (-) Transcript_14386:136-651(-)|eukprot:CAMPEP_0113686572 /NCGR_PEP_ID=MMETSP0038_2-20120614/15373_1 /TAXON_ID=2898 /ORGANISM="Cryptomonas paramecium" /LENGTH=171 /DNA_ID=CAMNT_0000606927 /DNA_START=838 /DNA_END=1353 /DNA_ORIENTATION=+ /assembly_acc=CAM_ASM_000170
MGKPNRRRARVSLVPAALSTALPVCLQDDPIKETRTAAGHSKAGHSGKGNEKPKNRGPGEPLHECAPAACALARMACACACPSTGSSNRAQPFEEKRPRTGSEDNERRGPSREQNPKASELQRARIKFAGRWFAHPLPVRLAPRYYTGGLSRHPINDSGSDWWLVAAADWA